MIFKNTGNVESVEESLTPEVTSLIVESALLESLNPEELATFLENTSEFQVAQEEGVVVERTIVRLDKQAKLSQAQKTAVFTIAREKNDPLMKKLITVWRVERSLEDKLFKKYGNEAMRRARAAMQKAGSSKSTMVKKATSTVQKQLGLK